jgi:sensor histidine kinase YesM
MIKKWICSVLLVILSSLFSFGEKNDFASGFTHGTEAFNNSDYERATLYLQQAISGFTANDDSLQLAECYLFLGIIYGKLNDYSKSEKYINDAKDIFHLFKNDTLLIRSYSALGNVLVLRKKTNQALEIYSKSLRLADSLHLSYMKGSILNNIGVIYYNQKNYKAAIKQYHAALAIAEDDKNDYGIGLSLLNIGISYEGMKMYEQAKHFLESGIQKAKAIHDLYLLETGYEQLSIVYFNMGNYKAAYNNLDLYTAVKDSISSVEINKKVQEVEAKYQTQRKELEILSLKAEKQKNTIQVLESERKIKSLQYTLGWFLGIFVVILVVSVLFYRLYKSKLSLSLNLERNKNELEKKNADLNNSLQLNSKLQNALKQDLDNYKQLAYRKQMNPHFIFNSLNAVQNYILTNNKLAANFYLGELSTLIRRVLENSEKEFVSLKEELFVSETYIKLEQKRFEEKFVYHINCDESIDTSKVKIPPLLLQPFIENAIWHGLLHKPQNAILEINIEQKKDNTVSIEIKDNGVGRNSTSHVQHANKQESLGINLTLNRISLNNYLLDDKIALQINDLFDDKQNPSGTEVIVMLEQNKAS